jgi:disulfide bond formation protein DsbB
MLRVLAIIGVAASLLASGLAEAHVGGVERAVFEAPPTPVPSEAGAQHHVLVAGDAADVPWPIALTVLLAAAALARRRSRGLVAAVLVLLVAIFGVEATVHSVHHALGDDPVACPTASIAAHLNGTTVVALALDEPIQQVGAATTQPGPLLASLRSLDPSQPRAPPSPIV